MPLPFSQKLMASPFKWISPNGTILCAVYLQSFMEDEQYKAVRDKFFAGELHAPTRSARDNSNKGRETKPNTPEALFLRIEGRLRAVVIKACQNSAPACKIVESFEEFLMAVFDTTTDTQYEVPASWDDVLLEKPHIVKTETPSGTATSPAVVKLKFDGASSSGAFHRLLVHAVCQFHGLKTSSSTYDTEEGEKARALTVTGDAIGGEHRLLEHLAYLQQQRQQHLSAALSTTTLPSMVVGDLTSRMAGLELARK